MKNKLIKLIQIEMNYGIDKKEELTKEEKIKRIREYQINQSIEDYIVLFKKIDNYLQNEEDDNKEKLIDILINYIRGDIFIEENLEILSPFINNIYHSFLRLHEISILFEAIESLDIVIPDQYERIVVEYLNYLENINNEYYIQNCYSKIDKFNNRLIKYLNRNKKAFDRDLINILNNKINDTQIKKY